MYLKGNNIDIPLSVVMTKHLLLEFVCSLVKALCHSHIHISFANVYHHTRTNQFSTHMPRLCTTKGS